ncbi:hypothetical protein D3C86_1335780 [compost metagenome]
MPFQILVHHWYNTDREIAGDTTTNLEEANSFTAAVCTVPLCQEDHIINTILNSAYLQLSFNAVACKDITGSTVFPTWYNDRNIFFCSGNDP